MVRRNILGCAMLIAAIVHTTDATAVSAEDTYPNRQIHLIVAFPPGGGVDGVARRLAEQLGQQLKQTVVVENKPGAGGNLAAGLVANAKPDGYTLLYTAYAGQVIAKASNAPLKFDPIEDLAPVAFTASSSVSLVVRNDLPVNSYQEFIAYARKHPGKLNFGTNGVGSSYHLALERIKAEEDVQIVHIPFQGGAPAQAAVMGGQVDAIFATITQALPAIQAGKLKPIALASAPRSPLLPNIPTIAESGLPSYNQASNTAIFAPKGTPSAIVDKLNKAATVAMHSEEMKKMMTAEGIIYPGEFSPNQFAELLQKDVVDMRKLIKRRELSFYK